MEHGLNSESRRLGSDVERLSLEAQRKEHEVALLMGVICRLETELARNSNMTPTQAIIGGANLRDLLQLSPPDLLALDDDIRLMRRKVLDRAPTHYAEDVQEYLTKAMREAMIRKGIRYDDGANSDWKDPWYNVYQKKELEDDARLLGLRDSRRGVPGRTDGGRYDITVACDTLIGLSRWRVVRHTKYFKLTDSCLNVSCQRQGFFPANRFIQIHQVNRESLGLR
ncbi:uncharacterized protein BJ212DRAFT_1357123 [Suillus subaureus]|uniref:Uncharacterized protein n=1 Tax=Suillus subaureus TaxID=48587 RepID=A0A9P7EA96_9AGAM|nr:uncharacterized protein BJ212DRAFT_1357123 [Suillus subaureus]KAG1815526.1 hypothetical protein BJ212DRAFT_1357123 [Suillus subaureus]